LQLDISIVFSSKNGQLTLPLMLNAFTLLHIPDELKWQIIAVDNNSDDNTLAILESFADQLPLTILKQPKPGKNPALNLGVKYASGELIIFTDDDIIPDKNWLDDYINTANNFLDYDLFGGKILPYWMEKPATDILQSIPCGIAYALTDETKQSGPIKAGQIWGPNMAVRKTVFDNGFTFNEDIGPNGKNYVMGSETEFLQRAEQAGHKAYFFDTCAVQHIIRPWQLTDEWIENRAYKAGRAIIHDMARRNSFTKVSTSFGFPNWMLKNVIVLFAKKTCLRPFNSEQSRYRLMWDYHVSRGFCAEYKRYMRVNP
jgi:glycosyltransferase involved in cell wall biosynthesis